jgi:hypothetical protein
VDFFRVRVLLESEPTLELMLEEPGSFLPW